MKSGRKLEGNICLVTGSSRGIGKAIVRQAALEGAGVAINYLNSDIEAKKLADEIGDYGVPVIVIRADVSDEQQVEEMFCEIETSIGNVNMLVNNAGKSCRSLLQETSLEQWHTVIDTNLKGAFLCCRRALPYMIRCRFGRIINIASVWGMYGASCESVYAASKAGLIGLTRSLAKEVGPSGITVNAISPGPTATDMLMAELNDRDKAQLAEDIPVGRLGSPEEIAHSCIFLLASSSLINGSILTLDGGWKA